MAKEMKIRILYVVVLSLALLFLVSPFFIPIFFAGTISLTLLPIQKKLEQKGLKKKHASLLLTTLFAVVISIPVTYFIVKGTIAVTDQLEKMSANEKLRGQGVSEIVTDLRHDFVVSIKKFSTKHSFLQFLDDKRIDQYLGIANSYLLNFFKAFLGTLPTMFILLLIMLLCTYSFLNHTASVRNFFQKLTGLSDQRMDQLTDIFIDDSRQVYLSNIATGGIQSLIIATAVSLVGVADFFVVFFITLILSFIPVIGAAPVAFLSALLAFFMEKNTGAIILVVVGSFAGVVDNILRPWLASFGQSRIPPIVAFICVIGGAILLGFPGLFIGLLVGSIAYDTLPIFWSEIELKK